MPDADFSHLEYAEEDLFGSDEDLESSNINTSVPIPAPIHIHNGYIARGPPIPSSPRGAIPPSPPQNVGGTAKVKPVGTPNSAVAGPGPSTLHARKQTTYATADERLFQLRQLRRPAVHRPSTESQGADRGWERTKSLKDCCMAVIKANAVSIWDIGDLEYALIKPFVDELGKEQLAEIEENSPHIKRDTDWLWEIYMLEDYPLFHERCRDRRGEPRTSGWRRMYRKAVEDAAERQAQAADRVAARYKQLEEEKASKRIVMMDKALPEKKKSGWGRGRTGGAGAGGPSSASVPRPIGAIAKARAEAQRARVALTHASRRYVPPSPSTAQPKGKGNIETELYKNPYLPHSSTSTSTIPQNHGLARLPPPRPRTPGTTTSSATAAATKRPRPLSRASSPSSHPSSNFDPIPGSYAASEAANVRKALPAHLVGRVTATDPNTGPAGHPSPSGTASTSASGTEGRFRIDGPQKKLRTVKRPEVEKFQVPSVEKDIEKEKKKHYDYFAFASASATAVPPPHRQIRKENHGTGSVMSTGTPATSTVLAPASLIPTASRHHHRGDVGNTRESPGAKRERECEREIIEIIDVDGDHQPEPAPVATKSASNANAPATATAIATKRPRPLDAKAEGERLNSILFRKKGKKGR